MCGIAGHVGRGSNEAVEQVVENLRRVEYRGYDSAGVGVVNVHGAIDIRRSIGSVEDLERLLKAHPLSGKVAIGHTRWATHGKPDERNCHPHLHGKVAVVHNGIIENYSILRSELEADGSIFRSDTDTEVIPHLVNCFLEQGMSPLDATRETLARLIGTFALAILFEGYDSMLIVARRGSPLVVGFGNGGSYVGSDEYALASSADRILRLEDGDVGVVTHENATIYNADGVRVDRLTSSVTVTDLITSKEGYAHFMLKEIFEQPRVLRSVFDHMIDASTQRVVLPVSPVLSGVMGPTNRLAIVGCGTAGYAGLVGKYQLAAEAKIPVLWDIASEIRYSEPPLDPGQVCLVVSQSGETADTLAALNDFKNKGHPTLAVVNVPQSSIARAADLVLYTHAGPEIGVASTKAFTTQLAVLGCLTIALARERGTMTLDREREIMDAIGKLPGQVRKLLDDVRFFREIAEELKGARSVFYVGRGTSYPIALEGALKLKEISYIHAEGFPAGELKHGPIALIEDGVPVVALVPQDKYFDKISSNLSEIAARGGRIIVFSDEEGCEKLKTPAWKTCALPSTDTFLNPIVYAVAMQLIAYYTAIACGRNVDKPRNLAKSVTVE